METAIEIARIKEHLQLYHAATRNCISRYGSAHLDSPRCRRSPRKRCDLGGAPAPTSMRRDRQVSGHRSRNVSSSIQAPERSVMRTPASLRRSRFCIGESTGIERHNVIPLGDTWRAAESSRVHMLSTCHATLTIRASAPIAPLHARRAVPIQRQAQLVLGKVPVPRTILAQLVVWVRAGRFLSELGTSPLAGFKFAHDLRNEDAKGIR